jgi:hypothetical protein
MAGSDKFVLRGGIQPLLSRDTFFWVDLRTLRRC